MFTIINVTKGRRYDLLLLIISHIYMRASLRRYYPVQVVRVRISVLTYNQVDTLKDSVSAKAPLAFIHYLFVR